MKFMISILLIFGSTASYALEIEAFAGATSTTYEDAADANSTGFSFRTKINLYSNNNGLFFNMNARGIGLFAADYIAGYAWRTQGPWFFEIGGGLGYSMIYGSSFALLAGSGYRFSPSWFVNFPIIASNSGIFWSPYIGYEF